MYFFTFPIFLFSLFVLNKRQHENLNFYTHTITLTNATYHHIKCGEGNIFQFNWAGNATWKEERHSLTHGNRIKCYVIEAREITCTKRGEKELTWSTWNDCLKSDQIKGYFVSWSRDTIVQTDSYFYYCRIYEGSMMKSSAVWQITRFQKWWDLICD